MGASRISSDFDRLHAQLAEAVVACRAQAGKHEVHSLRTGTRKLEAVLQKTLEDHPGAARLRMSAKKALRELKRIRKAAGPVRDLDVHRQLAQELRDHASAAKPASGKALTSDYDRLDRRLQRRRKRAAAKLNKVLEQNEIRLEAVLQDAAESMALLRALSPPPLTTARQWVRNSSPSLGGRNFEDSLHGYRKRTKAARYIAGLEQASAPARRFVKRLKGIQDSIGRWHDLMLLSDEAEDILGKRSALVRTARAERNIALDAAARGAGMNRDAAAPRCRQGHRAPLTLAGTKAAGVSL